MTQAFYHPSNFGHFGLALASYAHFTSPIRRYADLVVHRALITAHGWGPDGLSPDEIDRLEDTARHISETERRSMAAERDTADRYLAAWLSERVGAEFSGRISGVVRFGVFVKLDETGADGLIPVRSLGREYFRFDPDAQTLTGEDTGLVLGIGQRVTVRLAEAVPATGGLVLDLLSTGEGPLPRGGKRGRGVSGGRKAAPAKLREARLRRKAERRRRAR
jgi:ribonuclease R